MTATAVDTTFTLGQAQRLFNSWQEHTRHVPHMCGHPAPAFAVESGSWLAVIDAATLYRNCEVSVPVGDPDDVWPLNEVTKITFYDMSPYEPTEVAATRTQRSTLALLNDIDPPCKAAS